MISLNIKPGQLDPTAKFLLPLRLRYQHRHAFQVITGCSSSCH